jgi:hypothetical protein
MGKAGLYLPDGSGKLDTLKSATTPFIDGQTNN